MKIFFCGICNKLLSPISDYPDHTRTEHPDEQGWIVFREEETTAE